jgi:hypothetical protein
MGSEDFFLPDEPSGRLTKIFQPGTWIVPGLLLGAMFILFCILFIGRPFGGSLLATAIIGGAVTLVVIRDWQDKVFEWVGISSLLKRFTVLGVTVLLMLLTFGSSAFHNSLADAVKAARLEREQELEARQLAVQKEKERKAEEWADRKQRKEKRQSETTNVLPGLDIAVTSLSVKKVDGKFRYFFQIRNDDSEPFDGEITIYLKREDGGTTWFETFSADKPLKPNKATFGYTDANTGPTEEYGEFKITNFEFELESKGRAATKGRGKIPQDITR